MSMFPVCCYTCRKVVNPIYPEFRERVRKVQHVAAERAEKGDPISAEAQRDMVAGVLSSLGIHRICCRIMFLSFVDTELDDYACRGEHLGAIHARTSGELSGTVKIYRTPLSGKRAKPSILLAR
jgi:DNA-directed RNA polymerase subunit N (RpoN/RPB10)